MEVRQSRTDIGGRGNNKIQIKQYANDMQIFSSALGHSTRASAVATRELLTSSTARLQLTLPATARGAESEEAGP